MNLQVLLSIMNNENPKKYIKNMNIKGDYIVINQVTDANIPLVMNNNFKKRIISVKEKGLSKSRNLAIDNSNANIGLISDDDMVYVDNYQEIILSAYEKYKDADLIAFIVEHEDKAEEKLTFSESRLGLIKSLRISSVQLTMNLNNIKKKKIRFDENFGSGSNFFMGEENIFMTDCLKKGLKIYYIPKKIGTLKVLHDSSWFKGYDKSFFEVKGAVFYRMSKVLCIPFILQFAIRKRNLYNENISVILAIKYMFLGIKKYIKFKR